MANPLITPALFFQLYDRRTFKELSGDAGQPQGEPANLQFCLDMAASRVNSYLNGRWSLSSGVPLIIVGITADIAAFLLFGRRPSAPEAIMKANERAEKWLNELLHGGVTIPGGSPALPVLQDSGSLTGKSEWDYVYGTFPTCTEPGQPGH